MESSIQQLEHLNEIEQLYLYNLEQIDKNINELINIKKNNINTTSPYISIDPIHNDNIIKRRSIINTNLPYWHEYLIQAEWALGGEYPDEESENNAVLYGNKMMLKYCMDELSVLSIYLLEDAQLHIRDHYIKHSCVLCDIKK